MNRFIARLFGAILALLHFLVLVALVVTLVDIFAGPGRLDFIWPQINAETDLQRLGAVLSAFLSYVLVMGALSTLVAINDHLAAIRRMSEEAEAPSSRSSSSVRRRGG